MKSAQFVFCGGVALIVVLLPTTFAAYDDATPILTATARTRCLVACWEHDGTSIAESVFMKKTVLSMILFSSTLLGNGLVARAEPNAGSYELRLNQAFVPGITISGANVYFPPQSAGSGGSSSLTIFAAGAGIGYFATPHLEVGASVNVLHLSSGNTSATSPGVTPFVRGFSIVGNRTAFYGEGSAMLQPIYGGGSSATLWGLGAELGLERFFTDSWALRIGVGYHYLHSSGSALQTLGANWAIAAYF